MTSWPASAPHRTIRSAPSSDRSGASRPPMHAALGSDDEPGVHGPVRERSVPVATHWCETGRAPSGSSTSPIAWRRMSPRTSGCTAISPCRCSRADVWVGRVDPAREGQTLVVRRGRRPYGQFVSARSWQRRRDLLWSWCDPDGPSSRNHDRLVAPRTRGGGPERVVEALNSRFVGVTAGLGTPRTLSWTGRRKTAPDTPTGVVTVEISRPAASPAQIVQSTSSPAAPRSSGQYRRTWPLGTGR